MAKHKTVRDFFEPWSTAPTPIGNHSPYLEGDFSAEYLSPDWIAQQNANIEKAKQSAGYVVYGSRMSTPGMVKTTLDGPVNKDDSGLLFHVRKPIPEWECKVTAQEIATRTIECVNALAGVPDPADTVQRMRDLCFDMIRGLAQTDDYRVVALLSRLLPPDQMKPFMSEDEL